MYYMGNQQINYKEQRQNEIDAVAGLMIIVMVVGHCVAEGYLKTFINALNFFMPWFYYKSGMLYRAQSNR